MTMRRSTDKIIDDLIIRDRREKIRAVLCEYITVSALGQVIIDYCVSTELFGNSRIAKYNILNGKELGRYKFTLFRNMPELHPELKYERRWSDKKRWFEWILVECPKRYRKYTY